MDEYRRANQALWDEWAQINFRSEMYAVDAFRAGDNHLNPLERKEVGEVKNKTMLHLQCHFGLDTLSWARLGAIVTGMDFSPQAINQARSLSQECNLAAHFLCCDIYDLPNHLNESFDIVYTSYGVLTWLPDLTRWAQIIHYYLKPGGTFYMAEFHPFAWIFDDDDQATELKIRYPYFDHEVNVLPVQGSYADRRAHVQQTLSYEWAHPMSEIVSALLSTGLQLEYLHEFPYTVYPMFPFLERHDDGYWWLPEKARIIPLQFSIRAHKP